MAEDKGSGTTWALSEDQQTVTLTFTLDPPVALRMGASTADSIMRNLGEYRAVMRPQVPTDLPADRRPKPIADPHWTMELVMMTGDLLLHLRDPRYGWLTYTIPRAEAHKLRGALNELLSLRPGPATAPLI